VTGRGRRRLLCALLVLGGIVAVLFAGPLLLDQERYRGILISRVSRLLNRKVTASSLRVRLLPSPEVTIRDLVIADRPPWSEPFVDAEQLHIALRLLPLLKGDIQVGNIRIDRPRIRLVRGPDGWNLDDLIRPTARGAAAEPQHRAEGTKAARGQPALPALVAGPLAIRHGAIVVDNPLHPYGPVNLEFKDVNLNIPAPLPPHPLRFQASGQLPGETSGSFELTGSVQRAEGDRTPIEVALRVRGLDAAQLASAMGMSGGAVAAFTGTLDVAGKAVGEWPRLDLEADADLRRLGVTHTKDTGKAPGDKARLRAKGRWEADQLDLSDVNLLWKGHTIAGRLHLATRQSPRLQFWLNTPDLSIEPIVAFASVAAAAADPVSAPRTSQIPPSPLTQRRAREDVPRTSPPSDAGRLQIEGHLRSDVLRWGKLILTTAESDLHYCCRRLTIRRLQGGFYGGTLSGDAALDWRGPTSHTTVTTHLEGVQTEPLLRAIQEPRWTLRGMMTLDSKMELSGQLGPGALAKVSGQTDIAVTNGRVTGYAPLDRLSKTADPVLRGLGVASPTLNEFDRLSAHWTINGGILRTRDLMLLRDGAKLYAAGSFNALNQTMDFDVTAKVAKTTLEAKLQGPSSDPVVTPQAGSIEGRIKTEVGKLLGKDRNKELGKMLQQLFSR
jgi:AsmA protein